MSNGRNRQNPLPNPERVEFDRYKGKVVRAWSTLDSEGPYLEGKVVWASDYNVGLETTGPDNQVKRQTVNRGCVARWEPME